MTLELASSEDDVILEGETAKLVCSSDANPDVQLTYRWMLDGVALEGEYGEELVLEGVDRRLNGREVACEVANSVGTTRTAKKLNVSCEY